MSEFLLDCKNFGYVSATAMQKNVTMREMISETDHFSICTRLSDLSDVGCLINLKSIEIDAPNVSDLSFLKDLNKLENLDLNTISADLSPLKELKNLRRLVVSKNQPITNFFLFKELKNLQYLMIKENHMTLEQRCELKKHNPGLKISLGYS